MRDSLSLGCFPKSLPSITPGWEWDGNDVGLGSGGGGVDFPVARRTSGVPATKVEKCTKSLLRVGELLRRFRTPPDKGCVCVCVCLSSTSKETRFFFRCRALEHIKESIVDRLYGNVSDSCGWKLKRLK